jgi:hypothetical protein
VSDDDCDCVECAESSAEKIRGGPVSPKGVLENFAIYGLKKRIAILDNLDAELQDEIGSSPHSLRRRVQLMELRRKMGSVHQALRRAKR